MHIRVQSVRLVVAALMLFPPASSGAGEKKRLTFDQIFNGGAPLLTRPLPEIRGWADEGHYLETRTGEARTYIVEAASGKSALYHDTERFRAFLPEGFDPAAFAASDGEFGHLLYMKEGEIYDLNTATHEFRRLTQRAAERRNPTYSPDGRYVAFTEDNNLCAIEISSGREIRYTSDGSDVVYNGKASWLYYEEILGRPSRYRAFWWSPDGSHIAFYRFDDSHVPLYPLFNSASLRGAIEETRYPRAGDPNPEVRIGIVPAGGGEIVWADFDRKADQYFGTPFWTPDGGALWVQWMNRRQDTLRIFRVDPHTGARAPVYEESQRSWVEWLSPVSFLHDGFLIRTDRDGWMHLYIYGMDGGLRRQLTSGSWNVEGVQAIDERGGSVFFTARKEATTRTDLYSVRLGGSALTRLTFGPYTHTVQVSPHGAHFITTYSGVGLPPRRALLDARGNVVRDLGDSRTSAFSEYELGKTEIFTIPTSDGMRLPALWTLPPDFDSTRTYPVLFSEYGGPNAPSVGDGWRGIGDQWLAGEGLIQISVDHRGSGHFGKAGVALMKGRLGTWEMHDYAEAVRWLKTLPFIDSTRIGITGGSYGGYVTCLALTEDADYFTHGVALFSVTDWRLYDSHYTERYMGKPSENPGGYSSASVLTYAGNYRGVLRIVHGTMDDNVHMQNSLRLIDTLESLGKHFEFMAYPGERHGWGGRKAVQLRNETYRFYYRHLLRKEFPAALFQHAGLAARRRR